MDVLPQPDTLKDSDCSHNSALDASEVAPPWWELYISGQAALWLNTPSPQQTSEDKTLLLSSLHNGNRKSD